MRFRNTPRRESTFDRYLYVFYPILLLLGGLWFSDHMWSLYALATLTTILAAIYLVGRHS